jgi:hypothetical protein
LAEIIPDLLPKLWPLGKAAFESFREIVGARGSGLDRALPKADE